MIQQKSSERILFLFVIGFILGIVIGNFFIGNADNETGVMSSYFLSRFQYLEIDGSQLFFYVFEERAQDFLILMLLGITNIGFIMVSLTTMWMGVCLGSFLSVCVMRMGIVGLGIGVVSMFPQGMIYILVYILAFWAIGKMEQSKRSLKNDTKKSLFVYFCITVLCFLLMVLGTLLESYVNPMLLKKVM